MPERGKEKASKISSNSGNAKFTEIQRRNLEAVKSRVQDFVCNDDSDEEIVEISKSQITGIFKNYQGSDDDVSRITQFFESGDNVDCLICKKTMRCR